MSAATRAALANATPAASATMPDLVATFRAMATDVTVRVVAPTSAAPQAIRRAEAVFRRVEAACTRFDPSSPLMVANAAPQRWHRVPVELFAAVEEAAAAYRDTNGLFDPRVLNVLRSWGYDRSLSFVDGPVRVDGIGTGRNERPVRAPGARRWRPAFAADGTSLRLGPEPVDLGGIGKGLAVRWAAEELAGAGESILVEAGGDIQALGPGPEHDGWHIAVENPHAGNDDTEPVGNQHGGTGPVAVLRVTDAACATSSVRIRRWQVDGRAVHHIVDPRTGEAGGHGLLSVTVVDDDPARAEVWSKALFLNGRAACRALADERGIAALLVDTEGGVGVSRAMRPHVLWQVPRGW
jgi:thiamine biosynthesis lipoprotein